MPHNCGYLFLDIQKVIRQIYVQYKNNYQKEEEINFYYIEPEEFWTKIKKSEKTKLLVDQLNDFSEMKRFNVDDYINFVELKSNRYGFDVRSVFSFNELVSTELKPNLLRELEAFLRLNLDKSIEVIAEKAKDKSPLRRL